MEYYNKAIHGVDLFALMNSSDDNHEIIENRLYNTITQTLKSKIDKAKNHLGYPVVPINKQKGIKYIIKNYGHIFFNNPGDPWGKLNYQLNTKDFERAVMMYTAQLYQVENYWGYVTTGSTEGNLSALYTARETLRGNCPNLTLLYSSASHYSVAKSGKILDLETQKIQSTEHGELDYSILHDFLSNPLREDQGYIVNLNIGTTMTGAIDSITKVIEIFRKLKIQHYYIHADAAFYGFVYHGMHKYEDLFALGLSSIAISAHKFLNIPMPAGVVLYNSNIVYCHVKGCSDYIDYIGSLDNTITGSRNGLCSILMWFALSRNGSKLLLDFKKMVSRATNFANKLKNRSIYTIYNEGQLIVAFAKPSDDLCLEYNLATEGNLAHICFMQNVSNRLIDKFYMDYICENSRSKAL